MFDTSLRYVMDYDFWLRAYAVKKPVILHQKLSAFRIHQQSKGGAQFVAQFDEEVQVLRRYCDNKWIVGLHGAHNVLITTVYKIIK